MSHKINIIGNLGKDPEMRYLNDGTPVTSFSVASSEYGGKTLWARVSAFGRLAETCSEYLSKGRKVAVWGTLTADEQGSPRVWNGSDGNPRASFEIRADNVEFLGGNEPQGHGFAPGADNEPF